MTKQEVHRAIRAPYHSGVGCKVHIIQYDGLKQRGDMWCAGIPDPEGAWALFAAMDPGVKQVVTYDLDEPDTMLTRDAQGNLVERDLTQVSRKAA